MPNIVKHRLNRGNLTNFPRRWPGLETVLHSVSTYAVTWRIEVVDDDIHRGYEYVRSEHHATPPGMVN